MRTMALAKSRESKNGNPELQSLSTAEILAGILLFVGDKRFSEQAIYRLFAQLEERDAPLAGRFRVRGSPGRQSSEPLRQALSFFEMGKVLELAPPNPVDQYYRARRTQLQALRTNLQKRRVLPAHEALLKNLAEEFKGSLNASRVVPDKSQTSAKA